MLASTVAARELEREGSVQFWYKGLVALWHVDQESNPCPLHWQADS